MAPSRATKELPVGREPTDDLWEAIFTQRAIRYWQDRPVPRELLERVVEAATRAPSGSNEQPWVFVVVDDREVVAALGAALRRVYDSAPRLRAYLDDAESTPDPSARRMLRGARAFFTQLERAPAVVVPCLHGLSSPTPDPTTLLAGSSIYLAVQNLLLAARSLGLGTVMTTAHTMIDAELRSRLGLPEDAHPVAFVPIGYPGARFGPTRRKPVSEVLRWNHWN